MGTGWRKEKGKMLSYEMLASQSGALTIGLALGFFGFALLMETLVLLLLRQRYIRFARASAALYAASFGAASIIEVLHYLDSSSRWTLLAIPSLAWWENGVFIANSCALAIATLTVMLSTYLWEQRRSRKKHLYAV
jgi:hypothetical protein